MIRVGIDVGSTYTKYCVMDEGAVITLSMDQTPVRQSVFFEEKVRGVQGRYPDGEIISCGYGRSNVSAVKTINELTALAMGSFLASGKDGLVLDIGGQDTKLIEQRQGKLTRFFMNDKCAAGSGMFLMNTLRMLGVSFHDIDLTDVGQPKIRLSSVCAVFAQSEIVERIADNESEMEIIHGVIWQIFVKARALLSKVYLRPLILSGGFSQIKGIEGFAGQALGTECRILENGAYLAAMGCAQGAVGGRNG